MEQTLLDEKNDTIMTIDRCLDLFREKFPDLAGREECVTVIELTEDALQTQENDFAEKLLPEDAKDPSVQRMGALFFYGFRMGAERLNGSSQCFTKQEGYRNAAIFPYQFDEALDRETDEKNPAASVSNLISWVINPNGNADIAGDLITRMVTPMLRYLIRISQPGKKIDCTVVLPPLSTDIEIGSWNEIFQYLRAENMDVRIENYGSLIPGDDGRRHFIVFHQTDGDREYVIVTAYEMNRGRHTAVGSLGFDTQVSKPYPLKDIEPGRVHIDSGENNYVSQPKEPEKETEGLYRIECRLPVNIGLQTFLGSHSATFGAEQFLLEGTPQKRNEFIANVFKPNETLDANVVCSRLFGVDNLYNISLGDVAAVADAMIKDPAFRSVLLTTKREKRLGTYQPFASRRVAPRVENLPANIAGITWKMRERKKVLPYFRMGRDPKTGEQVIVTLRPQDGSEQQIIEAIISHYDSCSTEDLADDLLSIYKNGQDPSAYFVAKVFMRLEEMPSVCIDSRKEIITSAENVDGVSFQEIQKDNIIAIERQRNPKPQRQRKTTIFKGTPIIRRPSADKNAKPKVHPISDMHLSVRTYNALKRANIQTMEDLTKMTEADLYKVRNLEKSNKDEVIEKLHELKLHLKDE